LSVASGRATVAVAMSKTALILTVHTQPGKRDELRALWDEQLRPRAEHNQAQELYLYCDDAADPDAIHIVEVYGDPDAIERNATAPWSAHYMRDSAPLIAGAPAMVTARPVWTKGYS
jgi:quinol monooxygenase YgiN